MRIPGDSYAVPFMFLDRTGDVLFGRNIVLIFVAIGKDVLPDTESERTAVTRAGAAKNHHEAVTRGCQTKIIRHWVMIVPRLARCSHPNARLPILLQIICIFPWSCVQAFGDKLARYYKKVSQTMVVAIWQLAEF